MRNARLRLLLEIALTIALAAVLNLLRIWQMPQGGTVSLVMLPIVVLGLLRGLGPALVAGTIFGVVDVLIEPYVVHPVQFLLDYPVAFGLVGLAGLFYGGWMRSDSRKGIFVAVLPAVVVASLARYAAHTLSGYVFFGANAPPGQPVLAYSAAYNSFVLVSAALTFVAAAVLMPALSRALDVSTPHIPTER